MAAENAEIKDTARTPFIKRWAALLVAFVLLVGCAIAFAIFRDRLAAVSAGVTDPGIDPPKFDLDAPFTPRDARRYLGAKDIKWETNLGGSGNDSLCQVINIDDTYYMFGETDSADGDLKGEDKGKLFFSAINENGRLLNAKAFGSLHRDTFTRARLNLYNEHFYVLSTSHTNNGDAAVYKMSLDGEIVKGWATGISAEETALDLYVTRTSILIAVNIHNQITGTDRLQIISLDHDLKAPVWRSATDESSVSYVKMYPYGTAVVALVNCDIGGNKYPAVIKYEALKTPVFTPIVSGTGTSDSFATDFVPADSGDFLVTLVDSSLDSTAFIYKLRENKGAFRIVSEIDTEITHSGGGNLFPRSEDCYFSVSYFAGNARGHYIVDGAGGLTKMRAAALDNIGDAKDYLTGDRRYLFLSETAIENQPNIVVSSVDESYALVYQESFGGAAQDSAVNFFHTADGGIIVFASTLSTGGDIGTNFGMKDVWIFKI